MSTEWPYRIRDVVAALLLLVFLLPVMLLVAILIKILMPGPVLFVQQRIGRHGIPFKIYKFRSMIVNSEKSGITLTKDKRITPLGLIIRSTKVDEFPQLFNILKGEMSLVGPRPDLPGYYDTLEGENRRVLDLRPGITGLDSMIYPYEEKLLQHQANPIQYYNDTLWPHKVRINYWYYQNRSFVTDLKILSNTLTILLIGKMVFRFPPIP